MAALTLDLTESFSISDSIAVWIYAIFITDCYIEDDEYIIDEVEVA